MGGHVLTFGETMGLFRATDVGDLAEVADARIATGGADSNVAIGLSRLGIDAVWVGRVGADPSVGGSFATSEAKVSTQESSSIPTRRPA